MRKDFKLINIDKYKKLISWEVNKTKTIVTEKSN